MKKYSLIVGLLASVGVAHAGAQLEVTPLFLTPNNVPEMYVNLSLPINVDSEGETVALELGSINSAYDTITVGNNSMQLFSKFYTAAVSMEIPAYDNLISVLVGAGVGYNSQTYLCASGQSNCKDITNNYLTPYLKWGVKYNFSKEFSVGVDMLTLAMSDDVTENKSQVYSGVGLFYKF